MSLRTDRVAEALREEIMNIIQMELKDPNAEFATVTHVRVSGDLKHAYVYFSIPGDDEARMKSLDALKKAKGFIRGEIGRRIRMKFVPELVFELDTEMEERMRVNDILKRIEEDEKR